MGNVLSITTYIDGVKQSVYHPGVKIKKFTNNNKCIACNISRRDFCVFCTKNICCEHFLPIMYNDKCIQCMFGIIGRRKEFSCHY